MRKKHVTFVAVTDAGAKIIRVEPLVNYARSFTKAKRIYMCNDDGEAEVLASVINSYYERGKGDGKEKRI